jgi:uncharacterized caspase-like protein
VVLVGVRRFADPSLPELKYATANVDRLKQAMVNRYAVDESQKRLIVLDDPAAATMKSQIADQLDSCSPGVQAVVYICTHGFVVDGKVYLAGNDLKPADVAGSGWPLDELVAMMESCRSQNKLLMLDLSHPNDPATGGKLPANQPSTGEMLSRLAEAPKSTVLIAGNSDAETGVYASAGDVGAFAGALSESFRGSADADRDLTITAAELFADVSQRLKDAKLSPGKTQTPVRLPEE